MAQSPTASAQRPAPNQKVLPHKDDIQIKTGKGLVYRPPTSDAGGILVACTILGCWTALFIHALWFVKLPWAVTEGDKASSWWQIAAVFSGLEFLYTGLSMTAHESMHGTISNRRRWLNDALGRVALSLYAWIDYDMMRRKHWEHHNHTGLLHEDPDFHTGNPHFLAWFARFLLSYSRPMQYVKLALWSRVLRLMGAPVANQLVFMLGASLLSLLRVFYHGTYLPHRPPKGYTGPMTWEYSQSPDVSVLWSFLTCYHIGYHWEHHRWPYAPWWDLPRCHRLRRAHGIGPASTQQLHQQQRQQQQACVAAPAAAQEAAPPPAAVLGK